MLSQRERPRQRGGQRRRRLGGASGRPRPRILQLQLASAGEHAERARRRHGVLVSRDVAGRRRRHERRQCYGNVAQR